MLTKRPGEDEGREVQAPLPQALGEDAVTFRLNNLTGEF